MDSSLRIQIDLPKYGKAKLLILKYSSFLKLQSGVKFRICNVCAKRLPLVVSNEHSQLLKKHEKQWNHYLIMMSKLLQQQRQSKNNSSDLKITSQHLPKSDNEDNNSSSSSGEA